MHKLAAIVAMAVALSGCVAVWGRPYEVETQTSESVTLKYDRNFASLGDVEKVAQANCAELGKSAVKKNETTSIWRISTVTFDCVKG